MQHQLTDILPIPVFQIKNALLEDAELHLVGGCIRDVLLKIKPKDYDFATILHPDEVIKRCNNANIKTVVIGIRRGTVSAIIDGESYEITTFRKKGKETLFSSTIEEDLSARDFTINAIAYNLHTKQFVDPFNGRVDLETKMLKTVGSPRERFEEDPHRILRMCRFAAQFDLNVSIREIAIAQDLQSLLANIEPERINAELKKIFTSQNGNQLYSCLFILNEVGFFKVWIPELEACKGVTQNKYHEFDVYEHIMSVVKECENYHVKLAALFHDIGKPSTKTTDENGDIHFYEHEDVGAVMTEEIMRRLKFCYDDIQIVVQLVEFHMRPINCGKKAIRKLKAALNFNFLRWMRLKQADKFCDGTPPAVRKKYAEMWNTFTDLLAEVEAEEIKHPTRNLAINGTVVMVELGLKPSHKIGDWLDKCHEYVYEFPERNNVHDLVDFLKKSAENEKAKEN